MIGLKLLQAMDQGKIICCKGKVYEEKIGTVGQMGFFLQRDRIRYLYVNTHPLTPMYKQLWSYENDMDQAREAFILFEKNKIKSLKEELEKHLEILKVLESG